MGEGELSTFLDNFQKCVSVFTMNSEDSVKNIFDECKITAESIKFTDGNRQYTVGKFKYSVVTNEQSITVFCKRV